MTFFFLLPAKHMLFSLLKPPKTGIVQFFLYILHHFFNENLVSCSCFIKSVSESFEDCTGNQNEGKNIPQSIVYFLDC